MAEKWGYTPEQAKAVKNLKVSNNILKADIKKLQAEMEGADEAKVAELQNKIQYKLDRIAMKEGQIAEIQAATPKVPVTYARKAAVEAAPAEVSEEI